MAQPILVDRKLERRHLRVDLDAPAGDAVEAVLAERLIKRVRDVEPVRCVHRRSSRGNKPGRNDRARSRLARAE